jgi:hypothetical protein
MYLQPGILTMKQFQEKARTLPPAGRVFAILVEKPGEPVTIRARYQAIYSAYLTIDKIRVILKFLADHNYVKQSKYSREWFPVLDHNPDFERYITELSGLDHRRSDPGPGPLYKKFMGLLIKVMRNHPDQLWDRAMMESRYKEVYPDTPLKPATLTGILPYMVRDQMLIKQARGVFTVNNENKGGPNE